MYMHILFLGITKASFTIILCPQTPLNQISLFVDTRTGPGGRRHAEWVRYYTIWGGIPYEFLQKKMTPS